MEKLIDRIFMVSFRYNGEFRENMLPVHKMLCKQGIPVIAWADKAPRTIQKKFALREHIKTSKVIVVDDSSGVVNWLEKADKQKVAQMWHATGAIKRFGIPVIKTKQGIRDYQYNFDFVPVASEYVRNDFAMAFGTQVENVKAVGIPKTDDLINNKQEHRATGIILYAPTFRDKNEGGRGFFTPPIDFDRLSAAMPAGKIFIIAPHPLIKHEILHKKYKNIMEIRDVQTSELIKLADVLIADYSSMIFDYALLGKPMAFFAYDREEYDRGFFVDYCGDMPGPILYTQEDLHRYINGEHETCDYSQFIKKYMGACDGHSTERVCEQLVKWLGE